MEEQKFSFGGSFRKTKEYIDSQLELVKLRAVARGSRIMGALTLSVIKLMLYVLILLFWSLALGFYISDLVDSDALGFLITGGILLLLIVLVNLAKKRIEVLIMNMTIRKVLHKWHEDDDDLERDRAERRKRREEAARKVKEEEAMNKVKNPVDETDEHK